MDNGQKQAIIQYIKNSKQGDFIDVYSLIAGETAIETRTEAKEILRELVDEGEVVPHPGSKYKVK